MKEETIMENHNIISKSKLSFYISIFIILVSITFTYAAVVTHTSVTIRRGDTRATSSVIGLSDSANYYVECYPDCIGPANVTCFAAWAGWPYTAEAHISVPPGKNSGPVKVEQSKNSNFYMEIFSTIGNQTHAYGTIDLN